MTSDPPKYRPLERFWPYAELPEQPTAAELAALDPDLYEALFGAQTRPFSITLVFPALDVPAFAARARDRRAPRPSSARPAAGARCATAPASGRATRRRLRDLFQIVGGSDATEVLIDDRPVPYARELWLPLVWFLIPR